MPNLVTMPRGKKKHATRPNDSSRTMCGREGPVVLLDEGFPDCGACKREIARAIAREELG